MVNNNQIPVEVNKKPFETVQELKDEYKVPSFEEFMKNYNENKETVDSYEGEFESYGDVQVKGTYYGPGFWDDIKGFVKPVTSGLLIAASVFPPTAAIAVPITLTVAGTGAATMGLGHITDNKELKEFGRDVAEMACNGYEGQSAIEPSRLNEYARLKNKK